MPARRIFLNVHSNTIIDARRRSMKTYVAGMEGLR